MPEIPEVRCFAEKLDELFSNKILMNVTIRRGPYISSHAKRYFPFREAVNEFCPHFIKKVKYKGKWMYFEMEVENPEDKKSQFIAFGIHHGMEGSWCSDPDSEHIILELEFEGEGPEPEYYFFQDSRRFGTFCLLRTQEELDKKLNALGPSVYGLTEDVFRERMNIKRIQNKRICEVMLDQKIISGIGNYLRADILYKAGINPKRIISSLSEKMHDLYLSIIDVAEKSYQCKATTPGNYKSSVYRGGYDTLVYNKKICPEGYKVEKFKDKNKRTMWWVPDNKK